MTSLTDDQRTWTCSCLVLVIVAFLVLAGRMLGDPFLALDFEVAVVYLPAVLAGLVALYLNVDLNRTRKHH